MSDEAILLSAGGTGGHLFPAEALAAELLRRGRRVVVVTDKRGHAFKSLGEGVPVRTVRAATIKPGIASKIKSVVDMGIGIAQAGRLIFKYRPGVIVGFGGYPSFPAVFAGQALGVPTVLHEQNAVLGKANAFLARRAVVVATSLAGTRGVNKNEVLTGIPLRAPIVALHERVYAPPAGEMKILVTGGSQGAAVFGDVVPAAIALLSSQMQTRLRVAHQCRAGEVQLVVAAYHKAGIPEVEVASFFSDMDRRLSESHLFIGRSGASSVAEAAMAGLPSIFVPLKHKDMQQKYNAESVTSRGGGWIMMQDEFTPAALAQKLRELLENPAILSAASAAAKACARPDAAQRLADVVEKTIK